MLILGNQMNEFVVSLFGPGLARTGIETGSGLALLGLLGFALGFALNHGSICTVIATTELVSEKRPARFLALFEAAAWGALVYAILATAPTMQQGWSPLAYLVPSALLFGIGTYVNGACVFGSVGHFGNGELDFGFAFLGMAAVFYVESLLDLFPDRTALELFPAAGAGGPCNRIAGHRGAEARYVTKNRVQLPAAHVGYGGSGDHLHASRRACAWVLHHRNGWKYRFDTGRRGRDRTLSVCGQLCRRSVENAAHYVTMADYP